MIVYDCILLRRTGQNLMCAKFEIVQDNRKSCVSIGTIVCDLYLGYLKCCFNIFTVRLRMHTHGLAVDICLSIRPSVRLSVCLSVCQMRKL